MMNPQKRYTVLSTIGTGATSRVDKAHDTLIGRTVALKTFLHGFGSGDLQKGFLREAQIVGRLAHPNIVSLFDIGMDENGVPYFVMEYVEGDTLEKSLRAGPLPVERAAIWAADLAAALSRAHRANVIHGDIKPANILVTKEGQIKLGDFGIARFATQVSGSGSLMGTPAYLSPEQIAGKPQDCRSDLFALGVVLYQMIAGVAPFSGTSVSAVCAQIISTDPPPPSRHNKAISPELNHIVMRCLAKNPEARYANAEALEASLYPFARSKPTEARRQAAPSPYWWKRPTGKNDLWIAAAAVLLVALLVPIVRAMRASGSHQTVAASTVAAASATPAAVAAAPATQQLVASGTTPASSTTVTSSGSDSQGSASTDPAASDTVEDPITEPPVVDRAFERHTVASGKTPSRNLKSASSDSKSLSPVHPWVSVLGNASTDLPAGTAKKASPTSTAQQTMLRVDIVSGVTDETVSIFSGDELLLTTPLQSGHLGDTLRFNCPITVGEHSLRVVVYRADQTVFMQKENNSEIHADGSNVMEVRVNRRAKMLLKHETSLEVVWPSTASPVSATIQSSHPAGTLSLR